MKRALIVSLAVAVAMGLWVIEDPVQAEDVATETETEATISEAPADPTVTTEPPAEPEQAEPPALDMNQLSYALGLDVAKNLTTSFKEQGFELSNERLLAGLAAGISGEGIEMTEEQVAQAINQLRQEMFMRQMAAAQETQKKESEANLAAGKAFLEENGTKEGVVTTESGLQYKIIEKGEGDPPKLGDEVTVDYHGTLIDGTVFDSSVKPPQPGRPAQPATFALGQVIQGWNEGLTHIGKGGKMMLYIPPDLAYGPNRNGPIIGPSSTLIFEVELFEIKRSDSPEAPADPTAE